MMRVDVLRCEGPSMVPTINESGDHVLVERLSPRLVACRKGDLVIAQPPGEPHGVVCKRVVGVAGDLVRAGNAPSLSNAPLAAAAAAATDAGDETPLARSMPLGAVQTMTLHTAFAAPAAHAAAPEDDIEGEEEHYVRVPAGCVWLEGDNKEASSDSRLYGPVPAIAERELVIKADAEGGRISRLEAAARIGMPIKTADNLIARYESQGRVSVDLRGKNGGHQVKMEPFQGLLVLDRLHLSSGLMLRQLQLYLNAETLRILLLRKGAALSAEERLVGGPLDEKRFLRSNPEVAEMYRSNIIMSPQTVGNWLSRVFSTKRHVLLTGADGASKANEPSIRRQRFKFARALRSTLLEEDRGEAAKSFLIFIDDALIESIDYRTRLSKLAGTGVQARDGEEQVAAVAPPPGGVHSGGLRSDRVVLRMQAALAVNPKLGVLHSALYNADNLVQVEPEGGATSMYRDSWHAGPFCEFLDDVLQSIHKRRYTLAGKRVFLVLDAAHEHGLECSTASLVRGLPSFARTKEALAHLDGELRILEMPPCSPQLNLAGYCLRRCYVSRVKCEYRTNDSTTCERCLRQKRECIPRVVVRGRAAKVAKPSLAGTAHLQGRGTYNLSANDHKNGNGYNYGSSNNYGSVMNQNNNYGNAAYNKSNGMGHLHPPTSHMHQHQQPSHMPMSTPQRPPSQQPLMSSNGASPSPPSQMPTPPKASSSPAQHSTGQSGASEDAAPGSPDSLPVADLDTNAYRSASLFDDLPHLGAHYAATASIVRAYRALGLSKPPTSVRWIVNLLYLLAITEKSMGMLHTSATLAVATGIELDVDQLNQRQTPLTEKQKTSIMDYVHSTFLVDDPSQAYFVIRLDAGDRGIVANQTYEFIFESAGDMVGRLSRSPHFRLWRDFVEDKNVCNKFTGDIVKAFLSAGDPVGDPAQISWTVQDEDTTRLVDKEGNSFSGRLFEYGCMSGGGYFNFLVFGFQEITPLDDGARRRFDQLKAAGINRSAATPGPPPRLQRFDSLFSEMLPPGIDDVEVAPAPSDGSEVEKSTKKSWDDVLPRMDSKELLDALDLVIDSVGGPDEIENGEWTH
ncbi:Mitochondrial inner membrane protease subunit 1 [Hondaea fermentalgiana]|uniref:Mitochondrial inner membrane protease subunit n=1 Tax=Hondaea fermentalgiana TaxID=2315210 RepID=A0A2R5GUE8_9STRA|nr:Mitochondrial inner membrane protease subunit 1 [Hondaea fermentalgiana]|eukprot:GBG33388.1 Mitochondrial inner membrane protease subunit 1 [Hondaea fermentalgiana]